MLTTESSLQSTPPRLTDPLKMLVNEVEDFLCESKLFEELEPTNKDESVKTVNLTRITTKITMILLVKHLLPCCTFVLQKIPVDFVNFSLL